MAASFTYDLSYLKSVSGILKSFCLVFCFLGFICIVSSSVQASNFRACFYNTIIWLSFLATSVLAGMHLFHIGRETIFKLNARKFECCVNAGLAFGCFIAAAVTVSLDVAAYAAATFFALLCFSLYSIDAYMCYRLCRQRDAVTQTQTQIPSLAHSPPQRPTI